eukprot:GEZU01011656.1.p1 GENE.GEZU01011656.1~~GEZU01011656.1.p1  ORF type:complete len:510 (+),score=146.52 GEZU01011656.1:54-1583(+)
MVLAELGSSITNALRKMAESTVVNEKVIDDMLKEICFALIKSDVNAKLVNQLRTNIKNELMADKTQGTNKRNKVQEAVFRELCRLLDPGTKPFAPVKGRPNVIMFVGLQGAGKTTTVTKYAYAYAKKGFKSCLICADTFRAGAFDQLKQNATKAGIPFFGSYTETDPVKIAKMGVDQFKQQHYDMIIVDTSGRHKQEASLFEEMKQIEAAIKPSDIVFVMDGSIGQAAYDQAAAFKNQVAVGSVIITKLDGHAKGGGALSAVAATKSPITFIGTGEHFDEFEKFNAEGFVRRLLGFGDVGGLVEKIQEAGIDQQTEMYQRLLTQGVFTLRDMREQFQNIIKMGPLSQVMSMLPGFTQDLLPKGQEKEGQAKIKKYITIMDSMTDEELDEEDIQKMKNLDSRIRRIARGSGRSIADVEELLAQFKTFKTMIKNMQKNFGKLGLGKNPKDLQNMAKGMPNMAQLAKGMDPRILKQMGGVGGMQGMMKNMMKNMGGLGNLGNLFGGQNPFGQ